MDFRREKKKKLISLNVTSLIDVMFNLVLFFLVSTTFLSQPAIKLELPVAKNSEVVRQGPIVLYVDRDGKLFLNDEPIEIQLLGEAMTQKKSATDEQGVILKADSRVSHGAVIEVIDILKGVGVKKLIISTESKH